MLSVVPLGRVLPALAAWARPWPADPPVPDPGHCAACGRLARAFSRPWHELTARDLRALRALPQYLTTDAFLHYLPAYFAAAIGCSSWGRDHFESIVVTLSRPRTAVPRYVAFHSDRVDRLTPRERELVAAAIAEVATRRAWPLGDEARTAIATLRGAPREAMREPGVDAGPTRRTWDWVGALQDRIAEVFPTAPVPTVELIADPRTRSDERRAYRAFGGVRWDRVSTAEAWSGDGALYLVRPRALPSCVPTFLSYALEPNGTAVELAESVGFALGRIALERETAAYQRARWNAFLPAQRRVIGAVLAASAMTSAELGAPAPEAERAASIWIDDAERTVGSG